MFGESHGGTGGVIISCMTVCLRPKTIDPCIPTRSTCCFHRPGSSCLHQARSAVKCLARNWDGGERSEKLWYVDEGCCGWRFLSVCSWFPRRLCGAAASVRFVLEPRRTACCLPQRLGTCQTLCARAMMALLPGPCALPDRRQLVRRVFSSCMVSNR